MKKLAAFSSLSPFVRLAPLLVLLVVFSTSCQFLGFGEKPTCEESVLQIAERSYQIKEIKTKSDGSLNVPPNSADTAYWVNGTNINYVFALSPTENNVALQNSLKEGDTATVTWANCNTATYKLSAPQGAVSDDSVLLDQNRSGITIFIPDEFVITGEGTEETITTFNTPDTTEIQAEISLLETTASADGKTIRVGISILNTGQLPITLSASDVSLTPQNGTAVAPENSEPALPKEIQPGATETFYFTFTHPNTQTATIKVLSAEYDLEDF